MSLHTIESNTRAFAEARRQLSGRVADMNELILGVRKRRMPGIRSALAKAQEAKSALEAAIEAEPEQFKKPRSIVVDGIKVGFQKQKGKILVPNKNKTIERLEKQFPAEAEICIKVEKKLVRKALDRLDAATLKALGITVTADTDAVLIKPQDSELDKLIDALLADDVED